MLNGSSVLKKILVVDDETSDRERICNVLRRQDYLVLATGTYSGAVNMLARHPGEIGLLITDISLPEKNGCELYTNLLRAEPELQVLFVSGPTGAEVSKFYNLGIPERHFLVKPFDDQELLKRVRWILRTEPLAQNSGAS